MKHQTDKPSILLKLIDEHIAPLEEKVEDFDPRYMQTFKHEIQEEFQSKIDGIKDKDKAVKTINALFKELSAKA